jgi:serine/threonine protein kinase
MEHSECGDAEDIFSTGCFLFKESVIRLFVKQLVKALYFLHYKCGIAHLDLKLPNLLLNSLLLPIITDFGFSDSVNDCLNIWRGSEFHIS